MGNNNWFTPPWILDSVYKFYDGSIDLDPFYHPDSLVKATTTYTEKEDGYKQPWSGNVYANPPYSRPNLGLATEKAKKEYQDTPGIQILMLIPAYTSTKWFQENVFNSAAAVLFYNKRISFLGGKQGSPTFHSVLVYWGTRLKEFVNIFNKFGYVTIPPPKFSLFD